MSAFAEFGERVAEARRLVPEGCHFPVFVLGSGMGPIAARISPLAQLQFGEIPGLVPPTVAGHRGELVLGEWVGRPLLLFTGRLHFYEGHAWERVVRPMELARDLGCTAALLTNAAGGIADALDPGALMAIHDHIAANEPYWWRQPGPGGTAGLRPSPYDPQLLAALAKAARARGIILHEGVYAAVTGPAYETPAEVRGLQALGADAVGMSTVREASRAAAIGLKVAAISCITNKGCGLSDQPLDHHDVLKTVAATAEQLGDLLEAFLASI